MHPQDIHEIVSNVLAGMAVPGHQQDLTWKPSFGLQVEKPWTSEEIAFMSSIIARGSDLSLMERMVYDCPLMREEQAQMEGGRS